MQKLAEDGAGVLFISSELEELVNLCDRILVMHNGEIVSRFAKKDFDKERILAAAFKEAVVTRATTTADRALLTLLRYSPFILFVLIVVLFGVLFAAFFFCRCRRCCSFSIRRRTSASWRSA